MCVCVCVCVLASSPGSLAHSREGEGREERHIVCACANYLGYHACMRYPRKYTEVSIMGVYKNTEIPKNVLENLRICRACCSAHYCKRWFTWSIISETSGYIIKVAGNHVNKIHDFCKQLNFSRLRCLCRRHFALHFACLPIDIEHGKF